MDREQAFLADYHKLRAKYGLEFVAPNQIKMVEDDILILKRQPKIIIQEIPGWEPPQPEPVTDDEAADDK